MVTVATHSVCDPPVQVVDRAAETIAESLDPKYYDPKYDPIRSVLVRYSHLFHFAHVR